MRFYLLVATFCASILPAYPQLLLTPTTRTAWAGKHLAYFEDKAGKLSFEQAQRMPFKPMREPLYSLGASKSVHWLRLEVGNQSGFQDWVFVLDFAQHGHVHFYAPTADGWSETLNGFRHSHTLRPLAYHSFAYPIAPVGKASYYLRIETDRPCIFPVMVMRRIDFIAHKARHDIYYGIYAGIFLGLLVYNVLLGLSLRVQSYLYYGGSLLATLVMMTSSAGYFFQLVCPDYPLFARYMMEASSSILAISAARFAQSFLGVRNYAVWLHHGLTAVVIAGCSLLVSLLFLPIAWVMQGLYAILFFEILLLLMSGIAAWRQKIRYSGYYVFAWAFYLVGGACRMCADQGFLPWTPLTQHIGEVGSALEVMLLSLALADRLNILRREKEGAQLALLEQTMENERILREQNSHLERHVEKRTVELRLANEELIQTHEEVLRQRDSLTKQNELLDGKNSQIEKSINAALVIQMAVLPREEKLKHLLRDYFIVYRPRDIVSGDFYWLNEAHGQAIFAIADCTGHGVPGAFITLIGHNLMDKVVLIEGEISPAQILTRLHGEIRAVLKQEYNGNDYGMDAAVMCINWQARCLTFAGARRDLFYMKGGELLEIPATRKGIGGEQNERIEFKNETLDFTESTTIYIGTDGLTDQNDYRRKRLGKEALKEFIKQASSLPLPAQQAAIEQLLDQHMKDTEQRDDILWVGVRLE